MMTEEMNVQARGDIGDQVSTLRDQLKQNVDIYQTGKFILEI